MKDILIEYSKKHPLLLAANFIFMLFVPFNELVLPNLYGRVVTAIQTMTGVENILIITIGAIIIAQSGYLLRNKINDYFVPSFKSFLKIELIDKILEKYNSNYTNITTGDIIYSLSSIPEVVTLWFQWINDYFLPYIVTFAIATFYFFNFDKLIGTAFLIFILVLIFIFTSAPQNCKPVAMEHSDRMSDFHEHLEELLNNMESIYSTNTKNDEIEKLRNSAKNHYFSLFAKTSECARKYKIIMIPIVAGLIATLVLRGKFLIQTKKVKTATFVSTFFMMTSLLASIFWIIDVIDNGVFDLGAISSIDKMIEISQEDNRPRQIMKISAPQEPAIGLYKVTFKHKDNVIFDQFSAGFERGQRTVITGPIGKGKSTLLKLLLGFYVPDGGDVFMNGKWYSDMTLPQIRRSIGYIPQTSSLFNNTVLYNVRYGNEHLSEEEVTDFIKSYGIDKKLPNGVLTKVGKAGSNVSGGQRQLIWCLRVMLQNPEILIMDEPTASMDQNTKNLMMKIMDKLMENKTVIFVSHDPYLIEKGTRRLSLGNDSNY